MKTDYYRVNQFQTLIDRLKTTDSTLVDEAFPIFQTLIDRLKTRNGEIDIDGNYKFQTLIDRLKTPLSE